MLKSLFVLGLAVLCSCGSGGITDPVDTTVVHGQPPVFAVNTTQVASYAHKDINVSYTLTPSSAKLVLPDNLPVGWSVRVVNETTLTIHVGGTVDDDAVQADGHAVQRLAFSATSSDGKASVQPQYVPVVVLKPRLDSAIASHCSRSQTTIKSGQAINVRFVCDSAIWVTDSKAKLWLGSRWKLASTGQIGMTVVSPTEAVISGATVSDGPSQTMGVMITNQSTGQGDGGTMCFDFDYQSPYPPNPNWDQSCKAMINGTVRTGILIPGVSVMTISVKP